MTDEELMKLLGQVADELIARQAAGKFEAASNLANNLDEQNTDLKTMMLGSMLYAAQECFPPT